MADKDYLVKMRHSAAHILAAAVLELFPDTKLGIGPVIDNGFFYDFDTKHRFTPQDLKKIEKRMKTIIARGDDFEREELSIEKAEKLLKQTKQTYKLELVSDLKKKGTTKVKEEESFDIKPGAKNVSIYRTGAFFDLCQGPHIKNSKDIGVFQLDRIAGAYWRGDEKNPQLQRIYGLAFKTKKELDDYLHMREEAEKRDHRKLGKELDLFTFSDLVGPGLPLWTPKGTLLRELLTDFVWELRKERGYVRVEIPHITKKELYQTSGHWDKFSDELFRITTREGHEFAMKPMNCPHHTQIYKRKKWSYRELPQRYSNTTMCYRDEQTGELHGLSRVRSFTQDDAHSFCRYDQLEAEMLKIWDIIDIFYKAVGYSLSPRLSFHDPAHPEKYLGDKKVWKKAETIMKNIVKSRGKKAPVDIGEAAFYGPKIDFMAKDSIGREWQIATIQLDLNMPEGFDLTCTNEKGEDERIAMVHAAIMGSIERFLSITIEHLAGAFPVWLAPVQAAVIPVGEKHVKECIKLQQTLIDEGIRAELYDMNETVGYKIRTSETQKVPYSIVIGDEEIKSKKIAIRTRGSKDLKKQALTSFIKDVLTKIEKRS